MSGKYVISEIGLKYNYPHPTRKNVRGSYMGCVIQQIRGMAKRKKHAWKLTDLEAAALITSICVYCGTVPNFPISKNGIDRIDSSGCYEPGNVASCCYKCNVAKNRFTVEEFREHVKNMYNYMWGN
jgi:hypothetical protein